MWQARFLTFAAVSALIAERVVALMGGREEVRLEARLAFERMYVSAIVRAHAESPEEWGKARRRLPGSDLASRALSENQPLTRNNFLKGQAVNGPVGVIATLARHLDIIDDEGAWGANGASVVLAWAEDEGLPKVLSEESIRDHVGSAWVGDATKTVAAFISRRDWPGASHRIWDQLAQRLRSDRMGKGERVQLSHLLGLDARRARVLGVLRDEAGSYRTADGDRGEMEREILTKAVRPALGTAPLDRTIATTIAAIDAYETTCALFQQAFEALIWGLQTRGGRAAPTALLEDGRVARLLRSTCAALPRRVTAMDAAISRVQGLARPDVTVLAEPLSLIRDECTAALGSPTALIETIMTRHERVQRDKRKATWIDRDAKWTLNPGFGIGGDAPPNHEGKYLHPFRIANAYSLMDRVGRVSARRSDGGT